MEKERTETNECWSCANKRPVPGTCHIECFKPDPEMTGGEYGIKSGWFCYPECFDPTWKTKMCSNWAGTEKS